MRKEAILLIVLAIIGVAFFMSRGNRLQENNNLNINDQVTTAPTSELQGPLAQEIPLTISQPKNNAVVTTPNIVISGKTVANADVLINDIEIKADAQGNFSTSYLLDLGNNVISVTSNDQAGNYSEKELNVTLQDTGASPAQ